MSSDEQHVAEQQKRRPPLVSCPLLLMPHNGLLTPQSVTLLTRVVNVQQNKISHYVQWSGYGPDDLGSVSSRDTSFLFISAFRPALGPTSLLSNGYRVLSSAGKAADAWADYWPSSSADVKNAWSYASTPPTRNHGAVLN